MNKVKTVRLAKGLTQKELSRRSGLTVSDISRIECRSENHISIVILRKLARGLEVTIDDIWPEDDSA